MAWLYSYFSKSKIILPTILCVFQCVGRAAPAKDGAIINFKKAKIVLQGKTIDVELAENDEQRSRGLMFREILPENHGMLFIFDNEQTLSFWMKNTYVDLAIGFFDKNRTLVDIKEMKAMASVMDQNLPSYPSAKPSQYALEMNKGWFSKNKIRIGSRFDYIKKPKSRSNSTPPHTTK